MGVSDMRAAFNRGLAGKGNCVAASMGYVPGSRSMQRITFTIAIGGATHTITEDVGPGTDTSVRAYEMAAAFAASQEG